MCRSACGLMPCAMAASRDVAPNDAIDAARRQPAAAQIQEERRTPRRCSTPRSTRRAGAGRAASHGWPSDPAASRAWRRRWPVERHESFLAALAADAGDAARQIDVLADRDRRARSAASPTHRTTRESRDRAAPRLSRRPARRAVEPCPRARDARVTTAPCAASRRAPSDRPGAVPPESDSARMCAAPPAAGGRRAAVAAVVKRPEKSANGVHIERADRHVPG